jgi:L-lactate dehydrogenase complex protein LldF
LTTVTSHLFKQSARRAIADPNLKEALNFFESGFTKARVEAAARLPEFERLRDRSREIKDHVLDNLDYYLERFEKECAKAGGQVHWCRTAAEARETVLEICRAADARTATKGKTMIAEEIGLNPYLEEHGVEPIETDLGEYIIQLADEPPSHIIAPAVHKTKDQVSDLFVEHHAKYGKRERLTEGSDLLNEAREVLRQKYLDADVGITGANFLIAETGTSIIVTNEGNGDLTQTLPKVHIVLASLEKVVPTLEDATTILRVLARSATGQEMAVYNTFSTGPRRADDLDGPEAYHVILLDNGRSSMLGSEFQDMLRCIRCGACMNACPVFGAVGGHAYGATYVGPMGSVLSPALEGLREARHLPNASSFCGRCESVCPMRIPLPKMMRHWRERAFADRLAPWPERLAIRTWAWFAKRPALYRLGAALGARLLAWRGGARGYIRALPLAGGWTAGRDLPAPEGRTFMQQWRKRRGAPGAG